MLPSQRVSDLMRASQEPGLDWIAWMISGKVSGAVVWKMSSWFPARKPASRGIESSPDLGNEIDMGGRLGLALIRPGSPGDEAVAETVDGKNMPGRAGIAFDLLP
jgi:hypothetical protein